MSEDWDAKLRERASSIDADAHDNYCGTTCPPDDSHDAPLFIKRVLDALRQTEEEALQEGMGRMQTLTEEILAATHAEGERAGREAEQERAAKIADVYADACPDCSVARQIASAIRYRGSE